MKKLYTAVVAMLIALVLSACGTVVTVPDDNGNQPRPETDNFAIVTTEALYNDLGGISGDFSEEKSVTTAEIGDNLVFVTGHETGPQFVHIRIFDPSGSVVAEEGPIEDWGGLKGNRYSLAYTPETSGRFYFEAVMSGANSAPFADSPYGLYVEVKGKDGGVTPPPPTDDECTSTRRATLNAPSSVSRNSQFNISFYVPCGTEYASLQVYNNAGTEVFRHTLSSTTDLERHMDTTVTRSLSYSQNDRLYVELTINGRYSDRLTHYVRVGSGPDTVNPPPVDSCTSSKRATLDAPSNVNRNERFAVDMYIPCGSTYVSLQVYNNDGREIDRWTFSESDINRYVGTEVTRRLSYNQNDRLYVELTVNGRYPATRTHYVQVGSGPGGGGGGSADTCDLLRWFDITDQNDRRIRNNARVRIDSRDSLSLNWSVRNSADSVRVTLDRDGREVYNSRTYERSHNLSYSDLREGDYRARIVIEEGRNDCTRTINFEIVRESGGGDGDTAICPSSLKVFALYGDFEYEGLVYIPRTGENFNLVWDSDSRDFDKGTYVQFVRTSTGVDVFQSANRSGSRLINPATLQVGQYDFRFTGYHDDGRTACLREVTVHIQ